MKYLHYITITIFLFSIHACSAQNSPTVLAPKQFLEKIKTEKNVQLIDVRTPAECANGMIEGAKNINWNDPQFEAQVAALDKQKTVLVYCAKGGRSHAAQEKLLALGFKNVFDLKGGYTAWKSEITE
jgi:rhodanese-related sulfurtransferase